MIGIPSWQIANIAIPYIGLLICGYILFNSRFNTHTKTASTLIVVLSMIWLDLIWNDVASDAFTPTLETATARLLLLIAQILIMMDLAKPHIKFKKSKIKRCSVFRNKAKPVNKKGN